MLTFSDAHCHMHDGVLPASIVSYHRSVKQTRGSRAISWKKPEMSEIETMTA